MRIAIIDGQGGGIGRALIERLLPRITKDVELLALGTHSQATAAMLRAGAKQGATGENAIASNAPRVDIIAGPIGIIVANAMLGELTPAMARAIGQSPAQKVLIPIQQCGIHVAGVSAQSLPACIDQAVEIILSLLDQDCSMIP